MFPKVAEDKISEYKNYLWSLWLNTDNINDERLMMISFFHKSFSADMPYELENNERLEFLWDAVLGCVISKLLYLSYESKPESELTLYKIALVREENLAEVALDIWLDDMVFLWHWEEKTWWRTKNSILSDCLEALLWYIYLDLWLDSLESFIQKYIFIKLDKIKELNVKSYKTLLQEYSQKNYKNVPYYENINSKIDDKWNVIEYKCNVYVDKSLMWVWFWKTKKTAQENSAQSACEKLWI